LTARPPLTARSESGTTNRGGDDVPIDVESLKQERDQVKESLRQIEAEARRMDAEVKTLRQKEIQAKREIDALSALIEIAESRGASQATE
jgi:chromosome segregation ATPase